MKNLYQDPYLIMTIIGGAISFTGVWFLAKSGLKKEKKMKTMGRILLFSGIAVMLVAIFL